MDTASVGLVRRVENMVADTPHYRDELNRRHEHALTRIAELAAVADEPFEHTDTVRVKRYRLDSLTAALQTSADSPEAKAKETEHQQRLDVQAAVLVAVPVLGLRSGATSSQHILRPPDRRGARITLAQIGQFDRTRHTR